VIKQFLHKLAANPAGYLKHIFIKAFITPFTYKKGDDYDARQYWQDRFSKYGDSLVAVGDEGMSDSDNRQMYIKAGEVFTDTIRALPIALPECSVLEIGYGTGYFTNILYELGVRKYTGADITDSFAEKLKRKFPGFRFLQKDITTDNLEGKFDLIVMIDVIEHIVTETKIARALSTLADSLRDSGLLILAPVAPRAKRLHFHVRLWDEGSIMKHLPEFRVQDRRAFRGNSLIVLQRH
jgi:SAM-dependent methyltransferase